MTLNRKIKKFVSSVKNKQGACFCEFKNSKKNEDFLRESQQRIRSNYDTFII